MNAPALYLIQLKLNTFKLAETTLLKIYFELSQPNLALASGVFTYTDANDRSFDLPIIYVPDGILLLNLNEGNAYTGMLKLNFATGETLQQKIGFALLPWLNEFSVAFAPFLRDKTFKGLVNLKVDPELMQGVDHFELGSTLISATQTLSLNPEQSQASFMDLAPETQSTFSLARYDKDGSVYAADLPVYVPALALIPPAFNAPNLGYGKYVDADTLQETYNIPTTHNILPQQSAWLVHQAETASLSDTTPLAVKSVISEDAGQYVQQHDLSQHNNYLDYSDVRDQGFAAGPNTEVLWNKLHQGNQILNHAGNITQDRSVETEETQINAPNISYEYDTRSSTLSGEQFTQTAVNAHELTDNEQGLVNNLSEIAPQAQEAMDTSAEDYISQNFNFSQFNLLAAQQFNHDGMLMIDADRFEMTEFTPSLRSFMAALAIPVYNIVVDIGSALFLSVAPSGLICLVKFSLSGNVQASNPGKPIYANDPAKITMGDDAKAEFAKLITSMKIAEIGDHDSDSDNPVDASLQIVSVTFALADGEEFSCSLSMSAPNVYTIDNETLNFKGSYQGWDFEGSTDFSADIVFVGWNGLFNEVTVAKPSSTIHPYPYQQRAKQLVNFGIDFLQSSIGKQSLGAALAGAGDPYLPLLQSLHESVYRNGMRDTLVQIGISDGIALIATVPYVLPELAAGSAPKPLQIIGKRLAKKLITFFAITQIGVRAYAQQN